MTHNEKRTSWIKEGLIAQGVGVVYGVTVTAVGHVSIPISFKIISIPIFT